MKEDTANSIIVGRGVGKFHALALHLAINHSVMQIKATPLFPEPINNEPKEIKMQFYNPNNLTTKKRKCKNKFAN